MGILKSVFEISPSLPIQCCEPITLFDASFTYCSSTYTMLQTHNISWRKFYLLLLPLYNIANPQYCLTQVLLIVPPVQCCEPITFLDASFTYCSSPYTMLRTHNIAWCKFYLTLLRGGKGEKHKIVYIAVFPILFVTDCRKNWWRRKKSW